MNRRQLLGALGATLAPSATNASARILAWKSPALLPLQTQFQSLKFFTPQHFGAQGDGKTDDTVAMASAFAAAAMEGGALYLARGTYIVDPGKRTSDSPVLKLGSNMRIFGEGTIKVQDNCGDYFCLIGTPYTRNETIHDVLIEGITIDQNVLANVSSNIHVAAALTTAQVAIGIFGNVRGVTIRGVTVYASGINTLDVNGQGATDISFIDCRFYWRKRPSQAAFDNSCLYFSAGLPRLGTVSTAATAVTWISGDVFLESQAGRRIEIAGASYIVKNVVDSHHLALGDSAGMQAAARYVNPQTALVNVRGCTWIADWRDSAVTACELHNCSGEASGNSVAGYQTANILYGTTDFTLRGNSGRDLRIACSVWSKTGQVTRNLMIRDNAWSMNNADRNAQPTSGIYLWYGTADAGDFENLDFGDNLLVFQKWTGTGPAFFLSSGISLVCDGNVSRCRIQRNHIVNAPVRGIKIGNAESTRQPAWQKNIAVNDNVIVDAGNNRAAQAAFYDAGIWASGNLEDCGIHGNRIHDSGIPRNCPHALYIDASGFTFTRVAVGGNVLTTRDGSTFPQWLKGPGIES